MRAVGSIRKLVWLVRHGEAMHNPRAEAMRSAGCSFDAFLQAMAEDDHFDADLTALGKQQAERARVRVEGEEQPEVVLVSPLSRAIDTAQIIFPRGPYIGVPLLNAE